MHREPVTGASYLETNDVDMKPKDDGNHGATSTGYFPPGHPIYSMRPVIIGRPDPPKKKEGKDD